jgi:hypothetical protein
VPDVFWPHFFASVGLSSDNPVLTAHFPVLAGQILCLPFMIMRSLVLGCLPELQNGQGSALKTCRLFPRLAPSNPPLEPITSTMFWAIFLLATAQRNNVMRIEYNGTAS